MRSAGTNYQPVTLVADLCILVTRPRGNRHMC
jgi:hypothetical protein